VYIALSCDDLSSNIINIKGPVMLKDNLTYQNVTFWDAEGINETDEGHNEYSIYLLTELSPS
jgi:hypothetical protein